MTRALPSAIPASSATCWQWWWRPILDRAAAVTICLI
jgi:hypothetical protein